MRGVAGKVRAGEAGAGRAVLPEALRRDIDARWAEVVGAATGCTSYAALREHRRAELEGRDVSA
jgi:hypothetical protein